MHLSVKAFPRSRSYAISYHIREITGQPVSTEMP
ncbi:hypothetical protein PCS_01135 [Desulfocurvibacter africanus PCS]|uniref:Uncharacterized protein n=2 Tax=Desulfocurvibacter africanus TaxID=873 RepID=F3YWC1_DESAF|nr:hypothetical protein Desaf_0876 [Desulfocurvibacter africanus subsp. africanus str. Walvis Bay]EMG38087.1 hypothetical protein PCS_01135 [Desulfocurvibacter africanus PCS]